jgi:hypothetical protein
MRKQAKRLPWLRLLALTAAMAAVIVVASGISYWHDDASGSDATCPICHVAHISALPSAPADIPTALTAIAWVVTPETCVGYARPLSAIPPPRAPPA